MKILINNERKVVFGRSLIIHIVYNNSKIKLSAFYNISEWYISFVLWSLIDIILLLYLSTYVNWSGCLMKGGNSSERYDNFYWKLIIFQVYFFCFEYGVFRKLMFVGRVKRYVEVQPWYFEIINISYWWSSWSS